jgi:hypothetical protein
MKNPRLPWAAHGIAAAHPPAQQLASHSQGSTGPRWSFGPDHTAGVYQFAVGCGSWQAGPRLKVPISKVRPDVCLGVAVGK